MIPNICEVRATNEERRNISIYTVLLYKSSRQDIGSHILKYQPVYYNKIHYMTPQTQRMT